MFQEDFRIKPALRWGMVGGGLNSQIGYTHRSAALRDQLFSLEAGAFDIDPERGASFGMAWGIAADRCYRDYQEMLESETNREDGIEVLSIATPNFLHYEICKAALQAGLHIVCEKPLCFTYAQALELEQLAREKNRIVGVTYGYTGATVLHQARRFVVDNKLGDIRVINGQFAHGFHAQDVEGNDPGTKWRVTPETAGPTYVIGDIGTHIFYISQLITGDLPIRRLMCTRQSFVQTRYPLEDNAIVLVEYENGAVGNFWFSAVNIGSQHQQKIRVVGSQGSIEWWDEHPNQLHFAEQGKPVQVLDRGMSYLDLDDELIALNRCGAGHVEGFYESWANMYRRFGVAIDRVRQGESVEKIMDTYWFPNIHHGVEGIRFVERCVSSADQGGVWLSY